MKFLTLLFALLITFSAAAAQQNDDPETFLFGKRASAKWSANDAISQQFDVSLPALEGREFSLLNINSSNGLTLGCDGFGKARIFAGLSSQVSDMFDYVKSNIAGLAINYIIYSNPTLYSLYDHLSVLKEFSSAAMLASCGSIRQFGKQRRDEADAAAEEQCIKDGGTPASCTDPDKLAKYVKVVQDKVREARQSITGKLSSSTKDFVESMLSSSSPGSENMQSYVSDLIPDKSHDDSGAATFKSAPKTVQQVITERSQDLRKKLVAVVNMPADKREASSELKSLTNNPGFKPISQVTISELNTLKQKAPARFEAAADVLATEMAIAETKFKIAQIKYILKSTEMSAPEQALSPNDRKFLSDTTATLEAELSIYEARAENAKRLSNVETQLLPK